jgi:hypothetical protein
LSLSSERAAPSDEWLAWARTLIAHHFDVDFYLSLTPGLEDRDGDPLTHFLVSGWRDSRNPQPRLRRGVLSRQ